MDIQQHLINAIQESPVNRELFSRRARRQAIPAPNQLRLSCLTGMAERDRALRCSHSVFGQRQPHPKRHVVTHLVFKPGEEI